MKVSLLYFHGNIHPLSQSSSVRVYSLNELQRKLHYVKNLNKKTFTHFMSLVSFDTPENIRKPNVF